MIPTAKFLVVWSADRNVKSQCRAVVDVVNDVPDAYRIQYLQFSLQSPVQDTGRTEHMTKEFVSKTQ